jgi:hypothetical protein
MVNDLECKNYVPSFREYLPVCWFENGNRCRGLVISFYVSLKNDENDQKKPATFTHRAWQMKALDKTFKGHRIVIRYMALFASITIFICFFESCSFKSGGESAFYLH